MKYEIDIESETGVWSRVAVYHSMEEMLTTLRLVVGSPAYVKVAVRIRKVDDDHA